MSNRGGVAVRPVTATRTAMKKSPAFQPCASAALKITSSRRMVSTVMSVTPALRAKALENLKKAGMANAFEAGAAGLPFATLRGYLKGFIDLVVFHDGRYFIVDWKSNHLGDNAADYAEAPLALAVSSCTAAMYLALRALGVGGGEDDEVITTPLSAAPTSPP